MVESRLDIQKWFNMLPRSISNLYSNKFQPAGNTKLEKALDYLLSTNFIIWQLEDEARRKDIPDSNIARVKRNIDKYNQKRNDLIDAIDGILKEDIEKHVAYINKDLPLNTETPGSVFDRLTILALRIYSLKNEIRRRNASKSHIKRCAKMLKEVNERSGDLLQCLRELFDDYYAGRKQLKAYRQHKLYNDPALNPALRK